LRTVGSALLVIVALLLGAVAGPAIWAQQNVVSESGFVDLAGPLGANTEFQQGLSAVVAQQSASQLNLPSQLQDLAAGVIKSTAQSLFSQPGYAEAWSETLRRSHALTFASAGDSTSGGDLHLDIAPLVGLVAGKVSTDVGVNLPTPAEVLISMDQPAVAKAIPILTKVAGLGMWFALIALGLLVLALVVARNRALTVALTGVGLAVIALIWLLGSGFVADQLGTIGAANDVARQLGTELGAVAKNSWQDGITTTFIVAAVLVAAGVVLRIVRRTPTT
jgi:hypothetical protein